MNKCTISYKLVKFKGRTFDHRVENTIWTGDAIDLAPVNFPIGVFYSIVEDSPFEFDQLIRYRTFIHVSFARGRKPRQMKLDFTDRK